MEFSSELLPTTAQAILSVSVYPEIVSGSGNIDNKWKRAIYARAFTLLCLDRDILAPRFVTRAVLESFQRQLFNHRQTNGKPLAWSSHHLHLKELRQFFS